MGLQLDYDSYSQFVIFTFMYMIEYSIIMYPNDTRLFLLKWEFNDQNLMADVIALVYGINSFILRVILNIYY